MPALRRQTLTAPSPVALEDWVRRHQKGVWRWLRALGCPAHQADDLTQETFLVALRQGQRAEPATAAYLRGIARHLWLRCHRDEGRRAARLADVAEERWQRECAADDGDGWLADLDACVEQLGGRSRRALELFYRHQCSRAEVGAALGLSEHGTRTLLQRVRRALRDCIEQRRNR